MIIKSKGHRWTPQLFEKMVTYLVSDKGRADRSAWSFFHNLTAFDTKGIIAEFKANDLYRKKRRNGVGMHHFILSFHEHDTPHLTPEILKDLTEKFLELRQEKGIAFARVHDNENHQHVHVLISANELGSAKATSKSKKEFLAVQKSLELYQREKYPELSSLVKIRGREREKELEKPLSEAELKMKERLGNTLTKKELMKAQILEFLEQSGSTKTFYDLLEKHGFELYQYRGKPRGIIKEGKKFRFLTLGIDKEMVLELERERNLRLEALNSVRKYRDDREIER